MREILFRGKRVDNGEWVNGYYVAANYHWHNRGVHKDWIITAACSNGGWFALHGRQPVVTDTIGQYTGLVDKNGKKIFEGDILAGDIYPYSHDGEHNYFAEVVWFDNSPALGLYTFKNPQSHVAGIAAGLSDYMEEFDSTKWEVIGNIHDNPELMEVYNAAD